MYEKSAYIVLIDEMEKTFYKAERFFYEDRLDVFLNFRYEELNCYQNAFGYTLRLKVLPPTSRIRKTFIRYGIDDVDTMVLILLQNYYI